MPPIPEPESPYRAYLGDSVYAEDRSYDIMLTAENGVSVNEVIYLEPAVLKKLIGFALRTGQIKIQDLTSL